jgi:hypothetical protein
MVTIWVEQFRNRYMADQSDKDRQVKENYDAFVQKLPELLATHSGKFALLHDREIVELFDSAGDAYKAGQQRYPTGLFSIQQVTESAADLGFFSCATPDRPA